MREAIMNTKKYAAEAIGTFWLTFAGCGSAVIAAGFPQVGIGLVGVSLAFGLSVVTMAYAIGHISGCHLNPAVTLGLAAGGRFPASQIAPYMIAQVAGAVVAGALHRSRSVRRRMGAGAALAVLGRSSDRRRAGRRDLSLAQRRARRRCRRPQAGVGRIRSKALYFLGGETSVTWPILRPGRGGP